MLRPDDFIKGQLVLYGWRAGKEYGGHLASEAIMHVIANRVRVGWGGWLDVLADVPNKSATIEQPEGTPQVWGQEFSRLLHSVESIFDGSAKDLSNGAVYFADLAKPVTNPWFSERILGDLTTHRKVADMNSLTFFI
jgi:hypothetical protein